MWIPSRSQVQKGILRPERVLLRLFVTNSSTDYNPDGIEIFDEDWDTLIILDACRYDVFAARSSLPGELHQKTSRGAATPEWLRGNFRGLDLRDTVYVTANPMYEKHEDDLGTTFHDVWHLWKNNLGWDSDLQTVPPDVAVEYARKAADQYPNKRLLVHLNQPHGPLLGPTAEQSVIGPGAKPTHERSFFEDLQHNIKFAQIPASKHRQAYVETFDLAHDAVKSLLPSLQGRTVISADHGEMLGERVWPIPFRLLSHYQGFYKEPLIKIPWLVHESGERQEIISEDPVDTTHASQPDLQRTVDDRLQDLGYLTE